MLFYEFEDKRKAVEHAYSGTRVVLLTNAISIFDILNSNETQNSSGEAFSAILKMFKIMLKSRCLQIK